MRALVKPRQFVGWGTSRLIARMGDRWHVTGLRDNGAFPVVWGLLTFWGFLALPMSNSITRQQEAEADMFGINASQQPLRLAEFMIRDADARCGAFDRALSRAVFVRCGAGHPDDGAISSHPLKARLP